MSHFSCTASSSKPPRRRTRSRPPRATCRRASRSRGRSGPSSRTTPRSCAGPRSRSRSCPSSGSSRLGSGSRSRSAGAGAAPSPSTRSARRSSVTERRTVRRSKIGASGVARGDAGRGRRERWLGRCRCLCAPHTCPSCARSCPCSRPRSSILVAAGW